MILFIMSQIRLIILLLQNILDDIEDAYDKLEIFVEAFAYCNDGFLAQKGYRKLKLSHHRYLILYRVMDKEVQISGIFHMLENYANKL